MTTNDVNPQITQSEAPVFLSNLRFTAKGKEHIEKILKNVKECSVCHNFTGSRSSVRGHLTRNHGAEFIKKNPYYTLCKICMHAVNKKHLQRHQDRCNLAPTLTALPRKKGTLVDPKKSMEFKASQEQQSSSQGSNAIQGDKNTIPNDKGLIYSQQNGPTDEQQQYEIISRLSEKVKIIYVGRKIKNEHFSMKVEQSLVNKLQSFEDQMNDFIKKSIKESDDKQHNSIEFARYMQETFVKDFNEQYNNVNEQLKKELRRQMRELKNEFMPDIEQDNLQKNEQETKTNDTRSAKIKKAISKKSR